MSRIHSVVGSHVSGMRSRSHHAHWEECCPIPASHRIDKIKQSVATWNFIHEQEMFYKLHGHRRILPALC